MNTSVKYEENIFVLYVTITLNMKLIQVALSLL